jgi:hypothetical protein
MMIDGHGAGLVLILSQNARRRIAILGQVSPTPALSPVFSSRQKPKVGARFLSENRLQQKLGEDGCPPRAMIPKHCRSLLRHLALVIPRPSRPVKADVMTSRFRSGRPDETNSKEQ